MSDGWKDIIRKLLGHLSKGTLVTLVIILGYLLARHLLKEAEEANLKVINAINVNNEIQKRVNQNIFECQQIIVDTVISIKKDLKKINITLDQHTQKIRIWENALDNNKKELIKTIDENIAKRIKETNGVNNLLIDSKGGIITNSKFPELTNGVFKDSISEKKFRPLEFIVNLIFKI